MTRYMHVFYCLSIALLMAGCGSKQDKEMRNRLPGIWAIEKDASRTMIYNSEIWQQMGPNQKEVMEQGMELFLTSVQIEFSKTNMSFVRGEYKHSSPYDILNTDSNATTLQVYFDDSTSTVSIAFRDEDVIEFSAGKRLAFPIVLKRNSQ